MAHLGIGKSSSSLSSENKEEEEVDDEMNEGFIIWGGDVDFNAVSEAVAHAWVPEESLVNDAHFLGEEDDIFNTAPVAHAECYFPSHASAQAVEIASFIFSSEGSAGGAEIVKAEAEAVTDRSPSHHHHHHSLLDGEEHQDYFSFLSFECDVKKASVPKAIALAEDKEEEEMKEEEMKEEQEREDLQHQLDEELKKKNNRHRAAKYWRWKKQFPSNKTLNVARVAATALRLRVNGKFQKKQKKERTPKAKLLAKKVNKGSEQIDRAPLPILSSLTMAAAGGSGSGNEV